MKNQTILALGIFISIIAIFICCYVFFNKAADDEVPDAQNYQHFFTLVGTQEHNEENYTEGLFVYRGDLFESTGIIGSSKIVKYEGISPKSVLEAKLPDDVFGEGSVVFDDTLYVLTWKDKKAFLLDCDTLQIKNTIDYPREGWGLTTDGRYLIASDGTDKIYFMDANLNTLKSVNVKYHGHSIKNINELEFDGEYIWANIWLENICIAIVPESGEVRYAVDFSGICPKLPSEESVMNGIAFDGMYYYFTGKNWPFIYKMKKENI